jgi:hypothetical protein
MSIRLTSKLDELAMQAASVGTRAASSSAKFSGAEDIGLQRLTTTSIE